MSILRHYREHDHGNPFRASGKIVSMMTQRKPVP
jgi:hypothetical protein